MRSYGGSRQPLAFRPGEPEIDSVAAVRRLCRCSLCGRLASDLPALRPKRKRGEAPLQAHAFCIVDSLGVAAFRALPVTEIEKTTLADLLALGWTLDDLHRIVKAA